MRVEVYLKPNCSLCERALEWLDDDGVTYVTHSLLENDDWFQRWRYSVPVIVVDGVERLALRFTLDELRAVVR
jgi:glutaredoxin